MKKRKLLACLLLCSLLLSGCSADRKTGGETENQLRREAWAASDTSLHEMVLLPETAISGMIGKTDADLKIEHRLIDSIPVYEMYYPKVRLAPVMILLHEHGGSKEQFLEEALSYVRAGFFCVLFDLYGYGERTVSEPVESIEAAVMASKDIDVLLEYYRLNPYADSSRFVLYGHSMGGSGVWHYLAYGKKEPMALIVCSAVADFTKIADMGAVLNGNAQKPVWNEETYKEYARENNPFKALEHFAETPMLVYQGMNDIIIRPASTRQIEKIISEKNPNAVFIYDEAGGHNATVGFLNRIIPFLKTYVR